MENNIKLFSHQDLDGYGCNIVAKALLNANICAENINYNEINERINEFIKNKEYLNYSEIFITDISVDEEVAEKINNLVEQGCNFKLFDHHPTALFLNKYDWCKVMIEDNIEKVCGTKLLYDYIMSKLKIHHCDGSLIFIKDLVENIKRYDTWLWKDKYNDIEPKQLNDLFMILGSKRFIEGIENCRYSVNNFIDKYKLILELEQNKMDRYIKSKNKEIISIAINIEEKTYSVGVVFAEQYISELGNRLSEMNPQYDLVAMINNKTVSYRTTKEDVNVGEIAKLFGGGGHLKAAGSQINKNVNRKYIKDIFSK